MGQVLVILVIFRIFGVFHVSLVLPMPHSNPHHNPKVIKTTKCEVWKYSNIAMVSQINFNIWGNTAFVLVLQPSKRFCVWNRKKQSTGREKAAVCSV